MQEKDGGPAFPVSWNANEPGQLVAYPGMTLRDYFAGQALSGLLASGKPVGNQQKTNIEAYAKHAYFLASAMLEARKIPAPIGGDGGK